MQVTSNPDQSPCQPSVCDYTSKKYQQRKLEVNTQSTRDRRRKLHGVYRETEIRATGAFVARERLYITHV